MSRRWPRDATWPCLAAKAGGPGRSNGHSHASRRLSSRCLLRRALIVDVADLGMTRERLGHAGVERARPHIGSGGLTTVASGSLVRDTERGRGPGTEDADLWSAARRSRGR